MDTTQDRITPEQLAEAYAEPHRIVAEAHAAYRDDPRPGVRRHWSRLTAQEQAAWLDWASDESRPWPELDDAADAAEVESVAEWAAANEAASAGSAVTR